MSRLVEACRSALYLLRKDGTDIAKLVRHELREAIKETGESPRSLCLAEIVETVEMCRLEISQFHHTAYPKCDGGCPAHACMDAATKVLNRLSGNPAA